MCDYDPRGVTGEICDPKTGKVFCKPKVTGPRCDTCVEGTYGLGYGSVEGCMSCECAPGGSRTPACDSRKSGKCDCRYGFTVGFGLKLFLKNPLLHLLPEEDHFGANKNLMYVRSCYYLRLGSFNQYQLNKASGFFEKYLLEIWKIFIGITAPN